MIEVAISATDTDETAASAPPATPTPTEPPAPPAAAPPAPAPMSQAPGATARPTNGQAPPRPISEAAKAHGGKVLRTAAVNPFAAIHLSRQTPVDVLHDAIIFNADEQLRRFIVPVIAKLNHSDAAIILAAFASSFHGGYSMGQSEASQGKNWHAELQQAIAPHR